MPILKPYDPDMFAPGFKSLGTPTKGSIIAGNGSIWQKLTVGANGTVLTANSGETTGLEWVAGGGGGGTYTIVSSDAELAAAFAASDQRIFIDTGFTATQDYLVNTDAEVLLGVDVILNMGNSYGFVVGAGLSFYIHGVSLELSTVEFDVSGVAHDLIQPDTGSVTVFKNITIAVTGGSSNAGVISSDGHSYSMENVRIYMDNNTTRRIPNNTSSSLTVTWQSIFIIGGGTSCSSKTNNDSGHFGEYNDINITGTWQDTSGFVNIGNSNNATVDGVFIQLSSSLSLTSYAIILGKTVSNVYSSSASIQLGGAQSVFSNINAISHGIVTGGFCSLDSFVCSSFVTTGISDSTISNGTIGSLVSFVNTVRGSKVSNIIFSLGASIGSSSNYHTFTNCTFGNVLSPGGATTLTITAGSTGTTAVACLTDSAIVDGTGAANLSANLVF